MTPQGNCATQAVTSWGCVGFMSMDWDEHVAPRWPVDLEATVAKNVRWLREGRGISQQQLGSDLYLHGFGMHQMTVAKLEAGEKPLRLNEVAAIGPISGCRSSHSGRRAARF